jgi:predicted ATPase
MVAGRRAGGDLDPSPEPDPAAQAALVVRSPIVVPRRECRQSSLDLRYRPGPVLTSATIDGFKCLRRVEVPLRPFTVLIGKNDTGKTSFLEALHVLGRIVAHQARAALKSPWAVESLSWSGEGSNGTLGWSIRIEPGARNGLDAAANYRLRIGPPSRANEPCEVRDETCDVGKTRLRTAPLDATRRNVTVTDSKGSPPAYQESVHEAALATIARRHASLGQVARALSSSVLYHLDARELAKASPLVELNAGEAFLRHDGFGLPSVLDALLGEERAAFDEIERELRDAVPFISGIRLRSARVGTGEPQVLGKALTFALRSGGEIAAPLVSDGVLLFLAYLTLLHSPSAPRVLLLEEPENGIHPRELKRIADYLRRITAPDRGPRQGQVILATHSPYFLDYVDPENVLVFGRRANGETVVRPLLEISGVRERIAGGLSVGEMWFNVGEDELLREVLA